MLPPVYAANSVNFISTSGAEGRDARPDTAAANIAQAAIETTAKAGLQPDAVKALQRLAELLGSKNVDTTDVLTKLALDFALLIGQSRQPDEAQQVFANRLADIILQMKADVLDRAEATSGLRQLGITPAEFATALKDPASATAARVVALVEIPGFDAAEHALRAAISSYEQNSTEQPALIAAQKIAGKEGKPGAAETPAPVHAEAFAKGKPTEAGAALKGERQSGATPETQQVALRSDMQASGIKAPGGKNANENAAMTQRPADGSSRAEPASNPSFPRGKASLDAHQGQHTMQVLRGMEVAYSARETGTTDVRQAASPDTRAANAASAAANAKTEAATTAPAWLAGMTGEEVAKRAQHAAKAMQGKITPLFAGQADNNAATEGVAQQRFVQQGASLQQAPARMPADAEADLPRLLARLPDVIPFAQIPFPPAKTEKETETRYGYPNREREQRQDGQADGDGQSMHQQQQDSQGDDMESEEKPFEAEVPLARNASDAERAYHMYQRFGGF